ncbi:PREDICTED: uncharacterized protein LOC109233580 [Nicotiana attenuata]|uniref:uncharacterized protein LOC109233580 n=1 Tax=Nicotiana attenuata TaxID=49451 RepID=UPI0009053686|nr:PREDICTED: uncharacterized protein LOC109233580 [Nicotiana attenuata]
MPELFYHDEGYYLVRFQTLEDMKEIMCAGPYTMNGRPMIMKHWSPYFDFAAEFLTDIPLWVRFPKLPMNCWSGNSLSRIASTIGIPMFADECTAKQTRISYARILIEVNVTKPLPTSIPVMNEGGVMFEQVVEYDWKPDFCEKCLKAGHNCSRIPKENDKPIPQLSNRKPPPVKQIWRTKEPTQVTINEGDQKHDEAISKEVSNVPKPIENKETHKEGEAIETSRQVDKGKMKAVETPMTYAKAIMSPVNQRTQASQSTTVIAIQKPPNIGGQSQH